MILLRSIIATVIFEFKRSLSTQRLMLAAVLSLFPPTMLFFTSVSGSQLPITDLFILILVGIVSILAQLLWATPNVYSELEGKSWIFLASRPRGRIALFLGKYASSVIFSYGICVIAITLCLFIKTYVPPASWANPIPDWIGLNGIALISCIAYSAIFSLIGTLFEKRAMVLGAAYVGVAEITIATVPAIINKFTARLHLQGIASHWLGWLHPLTPDEYATLYGDYSAGFHLICLGAGVVIVLAAGCFAIMTRQYITAEEA